MFWIRNIQCKFNCLIYVLELENIFIEHNVQELRKNSYPNMLK